MPKKKTKKKKKIKVKSDKLKDQKKVVAPKKVNKQGLKKKK